MALVETGHPGGFILSVANGHRSFENGTLASGQNLKAGAVLGRLTVNGHYVEFDATGTDGADEVAGVLFADVNAATAAQACAVVVRDCEVNGHELVWDGDIGTNDLADAIEALKALGIIVR